MGALPRLLAPGGTGPDVTDPREKEASIRVVDFNRAIRRELVPMLEEKLEQAKRGELASFAFACEHTDGGVEHNWAIGDGVSVYKLLGLVCMFKDRISEMIRGM